MGVVVDDSGDRRDERDNTVWQAEASKSRDVLFTLANHGAVLKAVWITGKGWIFDGPLYRWENLGKWANEYLGKWANE